MTKNEEIFPMTAVSHLFVLFEGVVGWLVPLTLACAASAAVNDVQCDQMIRLLFQNLAK